MITNVQEQEIIKLEHGVKYHLIYCVDCGAERWVRAANWRKVKRCAGHQYLQKRIYNSAYVKRARAAKKLQQKHEQAQRASADNLG